MKEFIFTFGYGQEHQNCFVAIKAETASDARREMVKMFDRNWAFQYDSREKAGVDRFNLTEIYPQEEEVNNSVEEELNF